MRDKEAGRKLVLGLGIVVCVAGLLLSWRGDTTSLAYDPFPARQELVWQQAATTDYGSFLISLPTPDGNLWLRWETIPELLSSDHKLLTIYGNFPKFAIPSCINPVVAGVWKRGDARKYLVNCETRRGKPISIHLFFKEIAEGLALDRIE